MVKIIIKKVILNNKSRKGEYYYIKDKNKPARYYKINNNEDEVANYYKKRYIHQIGYKKKFIKKNKNIKSKLIKGRNEVVYDFFEINNTLIKNKRKELLKDIIKGNADEFIKNENFKKLSPFIHYKITGYNENEEVLFENKIVHNIEQILLHTYLLEHLYKGMEVESDKIRKLNQLLGVKFIKSGKLNKIEIKQTIVYNG